MNPKQDLKRIDWPVGLHLILPYVGFPEADLPITRVKYSGLRKVDGWTIKAGRLIGTNKRVRIMMPETGTYTFIVVHEKTKVCRRRTYGDDTVNFDR